MVRTSKCNWPIRLKLYENRYNSKITNAILYFTNKSFETRRGHLKITLVLIITLINMLWCLEPRLE
jgi:hypothetical protein